MERLRKRQKPCSQASTKIKRLLLIFTRFREDIPYKRDNKFIKNTLKLSSMSHKMPNLHIFPPRNITLGNLSKDVFERRTSTGSEAFFLFIRLDAIKFSLLTFFSLLKTIYLRVLTKPLPNDAKSPLPVDVRRSKTLLLKLPNIGSHVNENYDANCELEGSP